jgi:hypothetical protein
MLMEIRNDRGFAADSQVHVSCVGRGATSQGIPKECFSKETRGPSGLGMLAELIPVPACSTHEKSRNLLDSSCRWSSGVGSVANKEDL